MQGHLFIIARGEALSAGRQIFFKVFKQTAHQISIIIIKILKTFTKIPEGNQLYSN